MKDEPEDIESVRTVWLSGTEARVLYIAKTLRQKIAVLRSPIVTSPLASNTQARATLLHRCEIFV